MNNKISLYSIFIVILLLWSTPFCLAHPHVFIQNSITIVFDDQGLVGIKAKWIFDEFFTNVIVMDYDQNNNNQFEHAEITTIQAEAFDNLHKFDYFTFIKIDGQPFKIQQVQSFSAALIDDQLIYMFFIPCSVSGDSMIREVNISQYDPTYYSNITLDKKQPIIYENEKGFESSYRIAVNKKKSYYSDQIHPVEIILQFKKKHE
ncbi:MAG: DUF1007 family protein [Deltaproteobacteria bacterium]|nr:DUF1007 family protein [Deltaproteobacteria bacterium]